MIHDEPDLLAILSEEEMALLQAHEGRPGHEAVALRAYELYLRRGGAPGRDLEDWLQAERELRSA